MKSDRFVSALRVRVVRFGQYYTSSSFVISEPDHFYIIFLMMEHLLSPLDVSWSHTILRYIKLAHVGHPIAHPIYSHS